MPMVGGATQIRLLKALEDNDSLCELAQELPKLARELENNTQLRALGFSVTRTVAAINSDPGNKWELVILLHSMHRDTIRSIIRGTVAYDSWHGQKG